MNCLQLFFVSFLRVFFSQFFMSLYYLLSLGLWLFIYFLFACRWLAIRSAHCIDYACRAWGPGFMAGQCSFSLFLIITQILFNLQSISLGVTNELCLFGIGQISSRSQSCCLIKLRKLFILSFLIVYFLLFGCALISRSSYIKIGIQFKESAYFFLGVHFLSL